MTVILGQTIYCEAVKEEIEKEADDFRILNMNRNGDRGILARTEKELRRLLQMEYEQGNMTYEEASGLLPYDFAFGNV